MNPTFVPIAYAIILLRANSVRPCVFWGHLYKPTEFDETQPRPCKESAVVARIMLARKFWAYGTEETYTGVSNQRHWIGFTRLGHNTPYSSGLAVIAGINPSSQGPIRDAQLMMNVGKQNAGQLWADVTRQTPGLVKIHDNGYGRFIAKPRSVAVYVNRADPLWEEVAGFRL